MELEAKLNEAEKELETGGKFNNVLESIPRMKEIYCSSFSPLNSSFLKSKMKDSIDKQKDWCID